MLKLLLVISVGLFTVGCVKDKNEPQLPPGMYDAPSNIKNSKINEAAKKKPIDESKIKKIEL